jgi:hypothetical protein
MIIVINNKSYYIYNRLDSNYLFTNAIKFLKFLLLKYTNDELFTTISEIEFIKTSSLKSFEYCKDLKENFCITENRFNYVLDDEDMD